MAQHPEHPSENDKSDGKVVDFREFRRRPDVRQKRIKRMEARLGPETQAKMPAFYAMILNDPRSKAILGDDASVQYRIEADHPLQSDWLPPEVFTNLYSDLSGAIVIAIEGVTDPDTQEVRVVQVNNGQVVWRSTEPDIPA